MKSTLRAALVLCVSSSSRLSLSVMMRVCYDYDVENRAPMPSDLPMTTKTGTARNVACAVQLNLQMREDVDQY